MNIIANIILYFILAFLIESSKALDISKDDVPEPLHRRDKPVALLDKKKLRRNASSVTGGMNHGNLRSDSYDKNILVEETNLLERLAFKYGTDKSKDDHKYVDVYSSLFDSRRFSVFNVTEIGISAGQSMQVWHEYFPLATIYGIDNMELARETAVMLSTLIRVIPCAFDGGNQDEIKRKGFQVESMDLVIDDGLHTRISQERVLSSWWPYVKPGGYYIIEDISDFDAFEQNPERLTAVTKSIFNDNSVYFVDAAVGHRAWDRWIQLTRNFGITSHRVHNSYMIIIRKRVGPVPAIHVNFDNKAMNAKALVT